jgi:7,8-dihydropterin-6-yl-methyl-4-(beta-D-ribofuranosyl)aminobenzene 5'-phosphate synthase
MITRRQVLAGSAATLVVPITVSTTMAQAQAARVTVLFDAFGRPSDLKRGWGYSSLIEYGGRRILFDTGSNGRNFEHNVKSLGIDLKNLDFVVISHRHNDHTAGLNYVLRENPTVTIYTPLEPAGFNTPTPPAVMNLIRRYVESVPDELRYFGGNPPSENSPESPWAGARFVQIREAREVLPGFFLFVARSEIPGTREMSVACHQDPKGRGIDRRLLSSRHRKTRGIGREDRPANSRCFWSSCRYIRRQSYRNGHGVSRQMEN